MNGHEVLKINNFQSDQQKIYIDKKGIYNLILMDKINILATKKIIIN